MIKQIKQQKAKRQKKFKIEIKFKNLKNKLKEIKNEIKPPFSENSDIAVAHRNF